MSVRISLQESDSDTWKFALHFKWGCQMGKAANVFNSMILHLSWWAPLHELAEVI